MDASTTGLPCALISIVSSLVYEWGAGKNVARTWSPTPVGPVLGSCTLANVAYRAWSGASLPSTARPTVCASGPLMRTTPMAPRPAAVAIAAIVSVVENIGCGRGWLLRADDDRLDRRVADTLRAGAFLGDSEMHDSPLVGVQRADFLRRAGADRLVCQKLRHLVQLAVLVAPEVLAVHQHPSVLPELPAERGADDVLQGLQRLASLR